jgi:hypothetical protein
MLTKNQFGCFVALVVASSSSVAQAPNASEAKIQFSESLRQESLTTHEESGFSSSTDIRSVSKGKLKLAAEWPIADIGSPDPKTIFRIQVGGFVFEQPLGSDPAYRLGNTRAKLVQTTPNGNTQVIVATANIQWAKNKLIAKIDATIPDTKPIAAADYTSTLAGTIDAQTKATLRFSNQTTAILIPIKVKVRRKTAGNDDRYFEVLTVNLSGETVIGQRQ